MSEVMPAADHCVYTNALETEAAFAGTRKHLLDSLRQALVAASADQHYLLQKQSAGLAMLRKE